MKYISTLLFFTLFWTPMFGQVDILELLPEHQRLSTSIKNIKEWYQSDYGDSVETNLELINEFRFDKKGRLIKEIEYETMIGKGDTVRVVNSYYKDSLLTKEVISTYSRFDSDHIDVFEIIHNYTYGGVRLVNYNRGDLHRENYSYNERGLIDTVIYDGYLDNKTSIYTYRDNSSFKKISSYDSNNNEIESTTIFDQFNREIKYRRFTSGNSYTTAFRKFKYNRNDKIITSVKKTVENWRIKKNYTYNKQDLLTSIKIKTVYPRSVSYEIQIEDDAEVSSKKIKRNRKSNKESEKRTVVKSHYLYNYNSNNLPVQILVDIDQRKLRPVIRIFKYEYY